MDTNVYDGLLDACSIEPAYWDMWGKKHPISAETRLRIFAEMGLTVSDEQGAKDAFLRLKEERCRRVLAPVQVVMGASMIEVPITLPRLSENVRFEWSVLEETGPSHRGSFTPSDLTYVDMCESKDVSFARYILSISVSLPPGYHHFLLFSDEEALSLNMPLVVCPERCHVPQGILGDGRAWGPEIQLYALRSGRNWGIGDLGDLKTTIEFFGRQGAGIVGVNPLCALFSENPSSISPYSPSSRFFLNYLYLDIEAIPDFPECDEARALVADPAFKSQLLGLRGQDNVDYEAVAVLKRQVLEVLFGHFRKNHLDVNDQRAGEFYTFKTLGGKALRLYGVFCALKVLR